MKVAMFFDGKNFYKALQKYDPTLEIHYDKFSQWVVQQAGGSNGQFVGAYYYTGYSTGVGPAGVKFGRFLKGLEMRRGYFVRWEPRVKRTARCKHCGKTYAYRTEKRVDTRLVAELILLAAVNAYDVAVIYSGDQDLIPAVEAVNAMGKLVYLGVWPRHGVSRDLRIRSFGRILLSDGVATFGTGRARVAAMAVAPPIPAVPPAVTTVVTVSTPATGPTSVAVSAPAPATVVALAPTVETEVAAISRRMPYVSMGFFVAKWQGQPGFPPPGSKARIDALNAAIAAGRIVPYDHTNHSGRTIRAIRLATAT